MHAIQQVRRCECLASGRIVVADNTNPSPSEWEPLLASARAHSARAICYWFPPDLSGSLSRNATREPETRVPEIGIRATLKLVSRAS